MDELEKKKEEIKKINSKYNKLLDKNKKLEIKLLKYEGLILGLIIGLISNILISIFK